MTEEQRQKILKFDTFSQADTGMARRFGGSGLGLHISNAITKALGGTLEIDSVQGQGSTFTATIPATVVDTNDLSQPPAQTTDRSKPSGRKFGPDTLKGARVLLAEDGPDNQRLLTFHREKAGAQVIACENGLLAIQALEEASDAEKPHLILMDMQMPELDGYGATRRLREIGYTLPVIALTAHAMTGDREKCLAAGCDDYCTKPIDKQTLIQTCLSWLPEDWE